MCMTKSELETKVAELRNLKAMKEELENEVKDAERQIIEYMTEKALIPKSQQMQKLLINHRAGQYLTKIN